MSEKNKKDSGKTDIASAPEVVIVENVSRTAFDQTFTVKHDFAAIMERTSTVDVRKFMVPKHLYPTKHADGTTSYEAAEDWKVWLGLVEEQINAIAAMYSSLPEYKGIGIEGVKDKMKFFLARQFCTREHVRYERKERKANV